MKAVFFQTRLPGPESNLGTPDISNSGSYTEIDSPRETDEAVRTCLLLIIYVVVM